MKNLSLPCLMCNSIKLIALISVVFWLSACVDDQPTPQPKTSQVQSNAGVTPVNGNQAAHQTIKIRGKLLYKNVEGGFWGFDADNGKKYTPSGLNKALLKDGAILELTGHVQTDMATFQQYGELFKVSSVSVIQQGQTNQDDNTH